MDDLIEQLRTKLKNASIGDRQYERPMDWEQADYVLARIAALEAENERLRREDWFEQFEEQEELRDNVEQRLSVVEADNARLMGLLKEAGEALASTTWDLPVESLARAEVLHVLAKLQESSHDDQ